MNDRVRESELVARAVAGDGEAFAELIQPFEARVYSLAYRMCGSREDAYDLSQEALLKAYRALGRFKGESSFSTWLYRVVSNTCLDQLRRQKRSAVVASLDEPIGTENGGLKRQLADSTFEPEQLTLSSEAEAEIRTAVAQLSPDHRLAVLLRDFEDLPYQAIAVAMGCSLGTVKSRISRARASLRVRLASKELSLRAGVYSVGQTPPDGSRPGARPALESPGDRTVRSDSTPARGVDA